jgi:enoyl-CoA hydratase/carnithine racemase
MIAGARIDPPRKEPPVPTLERDADVFILNLGDGENRFNPDWVAAVSESLKEAAAAPSPRALVVSAEGKNWSLGLDLEWLAANLSEAAAFLDNVHELFAQALELSVPSICAIQGHCFAAGAMLALGFDERIMREDRGFFCLPEVDINIPFTPGMDALIKSRMTPQVAHEAMTTGRRYGGGEAAADAIVQATASEDELLAKAVERAASLAAKNGQTLGTIKQRLYAEPLRVLRDKEVNAIPGMGG